MKGRVVVGMSGGVDSSVSALLLKEQGYEVIGLFMKNWEEKDASGLCTSTQDYEDVVKICESLSIPYFSINFVKEYWDGVFSHFLSELKKGHTPNPDVLCNREIKFKVFFEKARSLGAHFLATGHYAKTHDGKLFRSRDLDKDQTYFLHAVDEKTLQKVLFPIGHLTKPEVREIAKKHKLATSEKKDSTGICFIGEKNFRPFLNQYIAYQKGPFQTLEGKTVGEHYGVAFYTIGQRKGLDIGGAGEAWFVVKKDTEKNIIYVVQGSEHPALFKSELIALEPTWISGKEPSFPLHCTAKIRYRQPDQACRVEKAENGSLRVSFEVAQRAITPRQSIVFYEGDLCLGGAFIS